MNPKQLRELIIRPVLEYLEPEIPYSHEAEDLLMMTCAHESNLGEYVRQVGVPEGVGAYGIYQMEMATEKDIWKNYIITRVDLRNKILSLNSNTGCGNPLTGDLYYATAMARVHYYRVPEALPKKIDAVWTDGLHEDEYLEALGRYAKKYYNTELGKANWWDYTHKYLELVKGKDV